MTSLESYNEYLKKREAFYSAPMANYFYHQEDRYVHPFKIYGNVYYVGDSWVCVHLIDTGDGLLLIDAGNVGATALLIQAIWEMGFKPSDVTWIILSHGHLDHIGAARFFRSMFGSKIYLARPDAEMFKERPQYAFIQGSPSIDDEIIHPDVIIEEGDELTFGNTHITCRLVPGHTEGCVALFFDAYEDGNVKRCGYYGGFGFNTLTPESLADFGDPECKMWDTYAASLDKVMDEKVEIFLGNHTVNNDTMGKLAKLNSGEPGNPFLDDKEWKAYLEGKKKALAEFVEKNKDIRLI